MKEISVTVNAKMPDCGYLRNVCHTVGHIRPRGFLDVLAHSLQLALGSCCQHHLKRTTRVMHASIRTSAWCLRTSNFPELSPFDKVLNFMVLPVLEWEMDNTDWFDRPILRGERPDAEHVNHKPRASVTPTLHPAPREAP